MGINQNDPNFMQNMMQSPEVQNQLNRMMEDPAILDQIVRRCLALFPRILACMHIPLLLITRR